MHLHPPVTEGPLRTIDPPCPVHVHRLHNGLPILTPIDAHPWESRVVLNPAGQLVTGDRLEALLPAWDLDATQETRLLDEGGACVLLYRAQGAVDERLRMAPSSIGWAALTPTLELVARKKIPALSPRAGDLFDNLGLEDPRSTRIGDTYYLYYTGYSDPTPEDDEDRRVYICLATSSDLANWTYHGPIEGGLNVVNNKNAALLPQPVDGRYVLLHRPMEGPDAMAVHWATALDPAGPWTSEGLLFRSYPYKEFAQSWVGAGGPPIPLGDGRFLMIYHQGHYAPDGSREYDLSAALLDFSRPDPVVSRIEPLMRPSGVYETVGDAALGVDNVLFSCANYIWNDRLVIPYAGADSHIFGATLSLAALVDALEAAA